MRWLVFVNIPHKFMKKPNLKNMVAGLALAGLAAAFANSAQAVPLLNEPFDEYANGTTLDSTGRWVNFSGTTLPYTVSSGTVTATNLASGTSGEDDRNTFASAPVTTGILYYSALVTPPTSDSSLTSAVGDYFFSGYSTANGYLGRVYLNSPSTGTYAFGLLNTTYNATTNPMNYSTAITLGTQYKIVLRIDVAAGTSTLGVFATNVTPTSDSQLTVSGGVAGSTTGLDSVAIRQGAASASAFTNVIDGVQVGTTLADVAGITTGASSYFNAVPEPSTYALSVAGLSVVGFALRRKRRAV